MTDQILFVSSRISPFQLAKGRLRSLINVLHALIIRDIQTRFGSPLGFILVVLWPLSHILILLAIANFRRFAPPYGDNLALWFGIGVTYFMIFNYMGRFIMLGMVRNKALLNFSVINKFNIILSSILTEILVAFMLIISLAFIAYWLDISFMPVFIEIAFQALLITLLLGIGFGFFNSIMATFWPPWVTISILFKLFLWLTSAVYFVPANLPQEIQDILWWNPIVHPIELARTAWFMGYQSNILSIFYPLFIGTFFIFFGLMIDRFLKHSTQQ